MRLFAVGLSHRTAPVELRESVDFSRKGLEHALAELSSRGAGRELVVLSTCNRAEIYAVGDTDETANHVGRFFSEYHEMPHERVREHLYVYRGPEAARHLFRVAAGLDSLVVGEPQILGQVKTAYAVASDGQFTAALTNRLFHSAFTVGKRVRSETGLGEGAVSVSYAAIARAWPKSCATGRTVRCSRSTSPCLAMSRRPWDNSIRCSCTTSTICGQSCRTISRGAARNSRAPKRLSTRKWRSTQRGCSRARS